MARAVIETIKFILTNRLLALVYFSLSPGNGRCVWRTLILLVSGIGACYTESLVVLKPILECILQQ